MGRSFLLLRPRRSGPAADAAFATIVTKDCPGDTESELDLPDRWRLNIHVGRARFAELTGEEPRAAQSSVDFSVADTVLPHPVYRTQGWIAIVNPGVRTSTIAPDLLRHAYEDVRRRATR